jgi:hypothetical protein
MEPRKETTCTVLAMHAMHKDEESRNTHDRMGVSEGWGKALDHAILTTVRGYGCSRAHAAKLAQAAYTCLRCPRQGMTSILRGCYQTLLLNDLEQRAGACLKSQRCCGTTTQEV